MIWVERGEEGLLLVSKNFGGFTMTLTLPVTIKVKRSRQLPFSKVVLEEVTPTYFVLEGKKYDYTSLALSYLSLAKNCKDLEFYERLIGIILLYVLQNKSWCQLLPKIGSEWPVFAGFTFDINSAKRYWDKIYQSFNNK